jgi:hypothetical protein
MIKTSAVATIIHAVSPVSNATASAGLGVQKMKLKIGSLLKGN